jgi:hypothetical protein
MNVSRRAWRLIGTALFRHGTAARDELLRRLPTLAGDWPAVIVLTDSHLVTPALWLAFRRHGLSDELPEDARVYLAALYDMNLARNAALNVQLDEAIDALNRRGIRPMLLKGAAYLKLATHDDPGARVSSDLDLLIPAEHVGSAATILEAIGYRKAERTRTAAVHHLTPLIRDGSPAAIELHREVMSRWAQDLVPTSLAWGDRREHESPGYSVPGGSFAVLHRFVHDQIADRHAAQRVLSLRSMQDLLKLDAYHGDDIDWSWLADWVARRGYARQFKDYLYAASRLAGFRIPDPIRVRGFEPLRFAICEATTCSATLHRTTIALDSLSRFMLERRYGDPLSPASLARLRLRTLAAMAGRRLGIDERR